MILEVEARVAHTNRQGAVGEVQRTARGDFERCGDRNEYVYVGVSGARFLPKNSPQYAGHCGGVRFIKFGTQKRQSIGSYDEFDIPARGPRGP